jgi:hypothetical protein
MYIRRRYIVQLSHSILSASADAPDRSPSHWRRRFLPLIRSLFEQRQLGVLPHGQAESRPVEVTQAQVFRASKIRRSCLERREGEGVLEIIPERGDVAGI